VYACFATLPFPSSTRLLRVSHLSPQSLRLLLPYLRVQNDAIHTGLQQREHQARLALQPPQRIQYLRRRGSTEFGEQRRHLRPRRHLLEKGTFNARGGWVRASPKRLYGQAGRQAIRHTYIRTLLRFDSRRAYSSRTSCSSGESVSASSSRSACVKDAGSAGSVVMFSSSSPSSSTVRSRAFFARGDFVWSWV